MSNLTETDRRYLEKILCMAGGYVLDYSDLSYGEFFARHGVNIHDTKYQTSGTSKAKKMRAFWDQEPDELVSKVLSEMLDSYEADCDLNDRELDGELLRKCRLITSKLCVATQSDLVTDPLDAFLHQEFHIPNIHRLPVEASVAKIIEERLAEAKSALKARAHLSVIFLCGSVLEAVLLGAAQNSPEKFNRSTCCPTNDAGGVRRFHEWSLADLINVACDVGLIKPDVKTFGHGLRDFRNYIHPYQQMLSGFTPDEHTAKVCFQVLKAALASVAGDRR